MIETLTPNSYSLTSFHVLEQEHDARGRRARDATEEISHAVHSDQWTRGSKGFELVGGQGGCFSPAPFVCEEKNNMVDVHGDVAACVARPTSPFFPCDISPTHNMHGILSFNTQTSHIYGGPEGSEGNLLQEAV